MPGAAERARRSRRLAVVLGVVVALALLVLLDPSVRRHLGAAGEGAPSATAAPASPSPSAGTEDPHGSPTATPAEEVTVSECGRTRPVVRPERLTVVCGRGQPGVVVTEVSWGAWGQLNALGTAVVVTDSCDPTCGQGQDTTYAVSIVLDQVRTTAGGSQFTRATVVWTASRPARADRPLQVDLPTFPR